jgi:carbon storage regulator
MLILSRKKDESIMIGDNIEISIVDIKGDHVKLGMNAPNAVKVYRQEVYEAILKENEAAVNSITKFELPEIKINKTFPEK